MSRRRNFLCRSGVPDYLCPCETWPGFGRERLFIGQPGARSFCAGVECSCMKEDDLFTLCCLRLPASPRERFRVARLRADLGDSQESGS